MPRPSRTRTTAVWATAAAALALAVTGCGTNEQSASTSTTAGATDRLVVGVPDDAATFDPLFAVGTRAGEVIMNTYDSFMTYPLKSGPDGVQVFDPTKVEGLALESMTQSKDGRTWTLKVRPGMKQPDGTPITAETIKYTFERNFGLKDSGGAFMYGAIAQIAGLDSVKVVDDQTVTVTTKTPNAMLPQIFGLSNSVVFDEGVIAKHEEGDPFAAKWMARNTAGSGPFLLDRWSPGSEIRLRSNPSYWRGEAKLKSVSLKIIPAAATRITLLEKGDIDVAENLSAEEIETVSKADGVKVVSVPSGNQLRLVMNVKNKAFKDPRVRQAINYAVPYTEIVDRVYNGRARAGGGPVPMDFPGYTEEGKPYGRQDLAKAKDLLAQAGVSDLSLPLQIDAGRPDQEAAAIQLQAALKEVGITTKIEKLTSAVFSEKRAKSALDFFLDESSWWVVDPAYPLSLAYTCGSFFNNGNYCNKKVDAQIAKAVGEADPQKRQAGLSEAERQIIEDAPMVWIAQPNYNLAVRDNVEGVSQQNDEALRFWTMSKR
jgi:peptide/nickel transport system substrate-binding protein